MSISKSRGRGVAFFCPSPADFNPRATLPDLKAQYEVKLDEGLDTFVVIDGLPIVPEESRQKLIKFLLRKLSAAGKTSEDAVFMPLNEKNMSEGYVIC